MDKFICERCGRELTVYSGGDEEGIKFFGRCICGSKENVTSKYLKEDFDHPLEKQRAIDELTAHWKRIMKKAPEGSYAYGVVPFEGGPEAFSLMWDKKDFPGRVALFLGSMFPRKPHALTIFHTNKDGSAKPILKFGEMGGDWTPPEKISDNLKNL